MVFQRPIAIFRVWLGVSSVVIKGRLVMGLERFLVPIQPAMASLSYEYPSGGTMSTMYSNYSGTKFGVVICKRTSLTGSNDWFPHQLSGDRTQELVRNA